MIMKKKRVLLLGAAQHQMFSLKSIQAMGCEVVAIDRNPDSPGFQIADFNENVDIVDIDDVLKVAVKYNIDAILPLTDYGVQIAAAVSEQLGLIGLSPAVARNVTSKAQMRRIWEEKGVPSAKYRVVDDISAAFRAIEELNTWPLILKPSDSRGGGSRGVSRVDSIEDVEAAFKLAQSYYEDKSVIIEEFLDGIEHSMEILVYNKKIQILAVSDKEKLPFPYRVDKSVIYPTILTGKSLNSLKKAAMMAVQALDINNSAVHVELCTTKTGPRLFELGARFGGGHTPNPILLYLTGFDVVQEVTKILLGEIPSAFPMKLSVKGCVYRFLTPPVGILKSVSGLEKLKGLEGILDFGLWVKPGDEIHSVKKGGDRAGYIVAGGDSREEALQLANDAELMIKFNNLS